MDKAKCCLLPSLPSPNPQCIMRWETCTNDHKSLNFALSKMFSMQKTKKKSLSSQLLAFNYWLHGPNRRGTSQSWAEQGSVQRATPPERDLHRTEQVRASMGALVFSLQGVWWPIDRDGDCYFLTWLTLWRINPDWMLRNSGKLQPSTKIEMHTIESIQFVQEAPDTFVANV